MKEAIEILDYINIREDVLNKRRISNSIDITDLSFNCQLFELARLRDFILEEKYHAWQPSPDTPYKIELTKWVEKKKWFEAYERIKETDAIHKGNPYSLFESWQKICPRTTEEGEG